MTHRPLYLAIRRDGLGGRLNAMIGALHLADAHGGEFGFAWPMRPDYTPEQHALEPVEKMFSPQFIERHMFLGEASTIGPSPFGEQVAITGQEGRPAHALDWDDLDFARADLPAPENMLAAFDRIGFSEKNMRAVEAARAVDLSGGAAALHMRGGDIVYGRFRFEFFRFVRKVVPFTLAISVARDLVAEGRGVLIFGQDAEIARAVCRRTGAAFVGDISDGHGFDPVQQALFEITLMSRCGRIVAGNSAFALLAGQIGGVKVEAPDRMLSHEQIATETDRVMGELAGDDDIDALQRAFARWYRVCRCWNSIDAPTAMAELEIALGDDPGNGLYQLLLASLHCAAGQVEHCEATLKAAVLGDLGSFGRPRRTGGIRHVLEMAPTRTRHLAGPYLDPMEPHIGADRPYMTACTLFRAAVARDRDTLSQGLDVLRRSVEFEAETSGRVVQFLEARLEPAG